MTWLVANFCQALLEGAGGLQGVKFDVDVFSEQQGVTLCHFSAQLKRFLRNRGYISGLSKGCVGCVRGY